MKVLLEVEVDACSHCPFLNCSDTGEDCRILRQGIQEDPWSNINYQYGKGWRYYRCPLLNSYHLKRNCGIKIIKEGEEDDCDEVFECNDFME